MSTQTDLAELYTTFFNRAPDADGLAYWVNEITSGNINLTQIAENWMTQQPEGLTTFPSTLTDAQFIDKIYGNILGRAADTDGAQYWLDQLATGTLNRDSFAATLINGAKANTSAQGVLDSTLISNKATVGIAFADKGLNDVTLAAKVLTSVNADASTLNGTLAVISLIPAAAADQSAAILATVNQLLTNFATLISTAPGEVADAATYLQTILANASSTTNLTTLLANATALLNTAATNPAALDNPAAQGSAAVVEATPVVTTPPVTTFTATENADHVLIFGGTIKGSIYVTNHDDYAVFYYAGTSLKVEIDTVKKFQGDVSFSFNSYDFDAFEDKLNESNSVEVRNVSMDSATIEKLINSPVVDYINTASITATKAQYEAAAPKFSYSPVIVKIVDDTLTLDDVAELDADESVVSITANALHFTKTDYTSAPAKLINISVYDETLTIDEIKTLASDIRVGTIGVTTLTLTVNDLIATGRKLSIEESVNLEDTSANINSLLYYFAQQGNIIKSVKATDNAEFQVTNAILASINSDKFSESNDIVVADESFTDDQLLALLADDNIDEIRFTNGATKTQYELAFAKIVSTVLRDDNLTHQDILTLNADPKITEIIAGDDINYTKDNYTGAPSKLLINIIDSSLTVDEVVALAEVQNRTHIKTHDLTLTTAQFQATYSKLTEPESVSIVDTVNIDASQASYLQANASVIKSIDLGGGEMTLTALAASALDSKLTNPSDKLTIITSFYEYPSSVVSNFQSNDKIQIATEKLTASTQFQTYLGNGDSLTFTHGGENVKVGIINGTGATSVGAVFIFNTETHVLSYDQDGAGFAFPVELITLSGMDALTSANFNLVPTL